MGYFELISPNRYQGNGGYTKSIIITHTNEAGPYAYGKFPGTAESLVRYLANPSTQASYQRVVDRNGDVGVSVSDTDRAWAAGNVGNNEGFNICFLGWAAQPREEWLEYPQQLRAGAVEIARWCKENNIPAIKRSPQELLDQLSGVCGHVDTAEAWHETNHTDPGDNFPYDVLLQYVNEELGAVAPQPEPEGEDIPVGAAEDIVTQFLGPTRDGWSELAPQRDAQGKAFSIFKFLRGEEANVSKQTVVEAIATLVFEATLRIRPYRGKDVNKVPETVLGHAAASVGVGLDNQDLLRALANQVQLISEAVNVPRSAELDNLLGTRKLDALDPAWTPPTN